MDKRAQIAIASVAGVSALAGFYWLGTRTNKAPLPVYPPITGAPPADRAIQDNPAPSITRASTTTTVSTNSVTTPRDTVSLLPGQNGLTAQTPIVDKATTTTPVTQSAQPGQISLVGPSGRPSLPVTQPLQPGPDYEAPQPANNGVTPITGTQTTTTSTHTTVHTASTHQYHKVHKHQKSGNVHVARATKHTIMFAAKLPFRLRP